VAAGDTDGDGRDEIVVGAGPGGGPHVRTFTFDPTVRQFIQIPGPLGSFFAYLPTFAGGVRVAVDDLDNDGTADLVTAAGPGGGPHVRAFDSVSGAERLSLFAYDPLFLPPFGGVFAG
jgi:hypothetical protein